MSLEAVSSVPAESLTGEHTHVAAHHYDNIGHKRARSDGDEEAIEQQQQEQQNQSQNAHVNNSAPALNAPNEGGGVMAGRPVPPPLKFSTAEGSQGSVGPHSVASPLVDAAKAVAPAPMVRIKSRASASVASPLSPPAAAASQQGGAAAALGLKIASPPVPSTPLVAAGVKALRINSPTTSTAASGGPRFYSPTTANTKSPTRYDAIAGSSFARAAANATATANDDPQVRYTFLLTNLLTKDPGVDAAASKEAAVDIAAAMMKIAADTRPERLKSILHHLSDDKNFGLRDEIRRKLVTGEQLVGMSVTDLMNPEKRKDLAEQREWAEKNRDLKKLEEARKISSSMYTCPKCKKKDCSFYEKQTRSADEPMTHFITCNLCKFKWKIG